MLFSGIIASGQDAKMQTIVWKSPRTITISEISAASFLNFEGAVYADDSGLPWFFQELPGQSGGFLPEAAISDAVFKPLSAEELSVMNKTASIQSTIAVSTEVVYEKKKAHTVVKFIPLRLNPANGTLEKLVSFRLQIGPSKTPAPFTQKKSRVYASASVLKNGSWFKFKVSANGIYKITYNDLQKMGMDVSGIDPRNIRIYGNGGQMLPESNAAPRFDDLAENAIYVAGEGDGNFGPNDYILFYAKGTATWNYSGTGNEFRHQINKYSQKAVYFITPSLGAGKRITTIPSLSQSPNYYVHTFNDFDFHEKDSLNLIKSGREWYGEAFDVKTSYSFNYGFSNLAAGSRMLIRSNVAGRGVGISTNFKLYANGSLALTQLIPAASPDYTSAYALVADDTISVPATSSLNLRLDFYKGGSTTPLGWLNYFEINVLRNLSFTIGQMDFRSAASIGKGVSEFSISDAPSNIEVWDVSDFVNPKIINGSMAGNTYSFRVNTDSLHEFVAHDGSGFNTIEDGTAMANQNLHGLGQYDMVIITYPAFESEANRIAQLHADLENMTVAVIPVDLVYNEFSSGIQDITAIKDLMKMFYDRAGSNTALLPKYLLLFGDGSFDYLDRISGNTNFVPTFESWNSLEPTASYLTDDYYGFLDDTESGSYGGRLDIGIGRMPVKDLEEARNCVDKLYRYTARRDLATQTPVCSGYSTGVSNLGDWRNVICFVADDSDKSGEHFLEESDKIAENIDTVYPNYNLDKIYFDAYVQESTPGGQRYPDVETAINQRVDKGALIINYIGHGGEIGWAHEQVLGIADINKWSNIYNMPLFVTATCEFSRFDDPGRSAAGEYTYLNPNGGAIALFTTTRLAFSGSNADLNTIFFSNVLKKTSGKYPAMGDVVRKSKNDYSCASVISNFVLLGDPAMRLAYPEFNVITSTINTHPVGGTDTIKAMAKVTVTGYVEDNAGNKKTDFNGIIYPTVMDKRLKVTSRGNDAGSPINFFMQKNNIYKGKSSVVNGDFTFSFIVPKDIAYNFGKGRISYYSQNGTTDANGNFEQFIIGGTESFTNTDNGGPSIHLYMNNERFVSGGLTDPNPLLLAIVSDSSGINTVGTGIGHDVSAVLDENTDKTVVLNDYYEADLNTYKSGRVRYPFSKLAVGSHSLNFKAWDVFNNSSESSLDFVVAESASLALSHVLNYPNPFTTYTEFWFEHNQPCCGLSVQIQIFTISGKLIKTINAAVQTNGFRADPIPWDGTDDFGDPIGKGVYIYKLSVRGNDGTYADKIEKLVILK